MWRWMVAAGVFSLVLTLIVVNLLYVIGGDTLSLVKPMPGAVASGILAGVVYWLTSWVRNRNKA